MKCDVGRLHSLGLRMFTEYGPNCNVRRNPRQLRGQAGRSFRKRTPAPPSPVMAVCCDRKGSPARSRASSLDQDDMYMAKQAVSLCTRNCLPLPARSGCSAVPWLRQDEQGAGGVDENQVYAASVQYSHGLHCA